jgi:hypothetical protein
MVTYVHVTAADRWLCLLLLLSLLLPTGGSSEAASVHAARGHHLGPARSLQL